MCNAIHEIIGKTIKSVDTSSINQWIVTFQDGSVVRIEAERMLLGIYGPVLTFLEMRKPNEEVDRP